MANVIKAAQYAQDKLERIKWWQFWRKDEEEFWTGMLAAATGAFNGSDMLNKIGEDIFEKHKHKAHKWIKPEK
jgi:hypothetical protein